jgi:hypothetical protein
VEEAVLRKRKQKEERELKNSSSALHSAAAQTIWHLLRILSLIAH